MHGMCPKCAQQMPKPCGCPGSQGSSMMPEAMPEMMAMPMVGAPPSASPMSDSDKGKMREAAKGLLSKLQDLDFDNVAAFDLKIVMSGDADDFDDFTEGLDSEEDEADSNVAMLDDEKADEKDKG